MIADSGEEQSYYIGQLTQVQKDQIGKHDLFVCFCHKSAFFQQFNQLSFHCVLHHSIFVLFQDLSQTHVVNSEDEEDGNNQQITIYQVVDPSSYMVTYLSATMIQIKDYVLPFKETQTGRIAYCDPLVNFKKVCNEYRSKLFPEPSKLELATLDQFCQFIKKKQHIAENSNFYLHAQKIFPYAKKFSQILQKFAEESQVLHKFGYLRKFCQFLFKKKIINQKLLYQDELDEQAVSYYIDPQLEKCRIATQQLSKKDSINSSDTEVLEPREIVTRSYSQRFLEQIQINTLLRHIHRIEIRDLKNEIREIRRQVGLTSEQQEQLSKNYKNYIKRKIRNKIPERKNKIPERKNKIPDSNPLENEHNPQQKKQVDPGPKANNQSAKQKKQVSPNSRQL